MCNYIGFVYMYEHVYEHRIYMLHTYYCMQLNVLCNYTNLQLHASHATEFQLQMIVAKSQISSSVNRIGVSLSNLWPGPICIDKDHELWDGQAQFGA